VLGFFALIAAAVWVLPVSAASLTTLAVTTAVAVLSITIFALKAVVVPFLLFQICAIGLAVSLFSLQAYALAERRRRVKQALAGILPEQHLEEITAGRRELDLGPRSRVVTIMQIDIVQFSLASERMSPANAFVELRRMLTEITKIVHAYDGVVDNMMGDRILAFFGYRYDGLKNDRRHAERALECAVRIQRHVATAGNKDATFLPVRIGLNTAPIYAGDLGPNGSIRPTIIGNGINLAKRLEEVCEPFRVLMSMATFDSLPDDLPEEVALMQRRIPIKHAKDLVEVYEVDPFAKDPDTLSKVSAYHRDYLGITRAEERYPISTDTSLKITTNGLEGDLVNFSVNGVAFRIGQYIGKGAVLKLKIEDLHENIEGDLAPFGLQTILCEIKWGRYDDESDRFLHGGRFVNLSPEQAEALFRILRQYSSRRNFGAGEEKAS
jgi:class 3 adenylate cyclase